MIHAKKDVYFRFKKSIISRNMIRIFSISFLAEGVVILTGFANSIIITRALGVTGRGEYSLAMTIIMVLSLIFGDGLSRANTYLVGEKRSWLPVLYGNSLVYSAGLGFVLSLVAFAGFPLINKIVPGLSELLVVITFVIVPMYIAQHVLNALFLGLQDYSRYNLFLALPFVFYLLINLFLLATENLSPASVLLGYLSSVLVATILTMGILRRHCAKIGTDVTVARQSFHAGSKAAISHISLYLLFRVDIFLINWFLGIDAAGLYSIAVLLAELVQKLANTSGNVIFPKIVAEKDQSISHRLTLRVALFVFVVGAVFSIFMFFGGMHLIVLLFKREFAGSALALYWLLPGTVFMAVAKIFNFHLWAKGFPRITVYAPLSALILNFILNLLLIPRYGIAGSGAATSCSFVFYAILLLAFYIRKYGVTAIRS